MIRFRRITQLVSLFLFLLFLTFTVYPLILPGEVVNFYVQLSPLEAIATWLNTGRFITMFLYSAGLIALTLVFGRFFCGWICPMGITLDATDRALRPSHGDDSKEPLRWKRAKYGVLIATLFAAYFEANLAGWLDPLSIITRTYSQVVLPSVEFLSHLFFRGLYPIPVAGPLAERAHSLLKATAFAPQQQMFHGMAATALIFLAITLLVYLNRRFWCRFLCPLGALLALVSRVSLFKRVVDADRCVKCNKCVKNCRMGAILEGGTQDYLGECIECFTCQSVCPKDAVSFRAAPKGAAAATARVNLSRRGFLAATGLGLAAVPMVRLSTGLRQRGVIRPPGAGDIDRFMQTCVRCGACLRVCPTNGLQASWFENGVEGLWSPELIPRIGYCEFNCTLCGQICPSGAIKKMDEKTKQLTIIGLAAVDHNRCIPWTREENCIVCEEHCPVPQKAIRLMPATVTNALGEKIEIKRPYIVKTECIGCGICETKCPVSGPAAIRVAGAMPQERKRKSVGQSGISSLLPDAFGAWKATEAARTFEQDKLFDFINGGAEIYYEYGFTRAANREYAKGEETVLIDVYEMAGAESAFGIFSYEQAYGGEDCGAGDSCSYSSGQLVFRQGAYYVKVNYDGASKEKPIVEDFARRISELIGDKTAPPSVLSILPAGADAKKATLVAGPLTIRGFYPMGDADWAGFKKGVRGLFYADAQGVGMTIRFADDAAVNAAAAALDKVLAGLGFKKAASAETGGAVYKNESVVITAAAPYKGPDGWLLTLRVK
ncbi:MAG: DUF6599 family protein [bacterium]